MTDTPLDPAHQRQSNAIAEPLADLPIVGDAERRDVLVTSTPDGAVTVTLNRPEKKNAFDADLISALRETFTTLQAQDDVRVVFIRGAGGTFCAGGDIEWMRRSGTLTESQNRADAYELARMLKALHDIPALTVAIVEGPAMGGGAGLVAACDQAVAVVGARFAFSEVKLGLTPAAISPYVIEAVGARNARALFMTAEVLDAEAAMDVGLVTWLLDSAADIEPYMASTVRRLRPCAPGAIGDAKRLVNDIAGRAIDESVMRETAARIAARRAGVEGREGLSAFLDKRAPSWAEPAAE